MVGHTLTYMHTHTHTHKHTVSHTNTHIGRPLIYRKLIDDYAYGLTMLGNKLTTNH